MTMTQNKAAHYKKGLWAAQFCKMALFFCGYRVLAHRYKTPVGEIDLIAKKGKTLIFIEVKARGSLQQGADAIQDKAKRRIENTAKLFLAKNTNIAYEDLRIDVMIVTSFLKPPIWYKNAW